MKIPTRTRYGLRAMVEIARGSPERPITLREVSENQGLSLKYLEQLVAMLKAAGLVRSVRGVNGGYLPAKSPAETSLREVFVALEGPTALVDCVAAEGLCPRQPDCPTRETWVALSSALEGVLDSTTVADLMKRCGRSIPS